MGGLSTAANIPRRKSAKNDLIFYERIFNTTFFQKYLVVRYKHYNFAPRYKERRGHNGNDRRKLYPHARTTTETECV